MATVAEMCVSLTMRAGRSLTMMSGISTVHIVRATTHCLAQRYIRPASRHWTNSLWEMKGWQERREQRWCYLWADIEMKLSKRHESFLPARGLWSLAQMFYFLFRPTLTESINGIVFHSNMGSWHLPAIVSSDLNSAATQTFYQPKKQLHWIDQENVSITETWWTGCAHVSNLLR